MKADYLRYIAENSKGMTRDIAKKNAGNNYVAAKELAANDLDSNNPVRLALILNYAIFMFENLN
eukprot:CAMPEP_0116879370 /NCGR_PEP_ID=MMETSP0463-20121206/11174_1 /TAXON_ID=181622 /ORGANISM="Strombidinopsis sp, Strain SopsisLIS2011" /LENGTH=63 /DNA_ID=CAMNT_0004528631 /DNA_START=261 /DNA_END=452 /DNA_ORIENTATION=+